jgi:hypothetical protein
MVKLMKITIAVPCFECGCDSSHIEHFLDGRVRVMCDNCDNVGPKESNDFLAIEAWNEEQCQKLEDSKNEEI